MLKAGFFTAILALSAPAGLLTGRLSDRFGRKRLSDAMLPLAGICVLSVPLLHSEAMVVLVLIAYSVVGKLAWDPVVYAWAGDRVTARHVASVAGCMGIFASLALSSAFVSPIATGWIRDHTGSLSGGFYFAGTLALLGTMLLSVPAETVHERMAVVRRGKGGG